MNAQIKRSLVIALMAGLLSLTAAPAFATTTGIDGADGLGTWVGHDGWSDFGTA